MVGPDYEPPSVELPASWKAKTPPKQNEAELANWWKIFGDPQLNKLVDKALQNNPDLIIAFTRIREARERVNISEANLLPSADIRTGWGLSPTQGFRSSSIQNFSWNGNISWELDLFGGNRRSIEAAEASYLSTVASACAVRTSLLADLATAYFSWITAKEQLRIAEEQLLVQKDTLTIAEKRYNAELSSKLDVQQAISTVSSTESKIPALKAQVQNTENQLAVLLGTYHANINLSMPSKTVYEKTPTIPTGLPSDLLRRRPDIISAEKKLHQAVANIGVAVSDLYPKFSLTGAVSGKNKDFGELFRENNSAWSLGGNLIQPLFQGGALRANVRAQEAAAEAEAESYRKALISAVSEVESALIDYGNYTSQMQYLHKTNNANKEAFLLSKKLYINGETEFLNVIAAQRSWLSSEESLVTMRQNIRKSVVQLARALGGGW